MFARGISFVLLLVSSSAMALDRGADLDAWFHGYRSSLELGKGAPQGRPSLPS
jgi:hypothetical protein